MSFSAKFFLDNTERPLLFSNLNIQQGVDATLRPDSLPDGGEITLVLTDIHDDLISWMLSPDLMKNGKIRYYPCDGVSKTEDLEFWDCHCTGLTIRFAQFNSAPITTEMTISAGIIKFRGAVHEKPWKITDLSKPVAETAPAATQQEKPELVKCHMEDEQGNSIKRAKRAQTVYLVVQTKDMVGKKIDIDLSDSKIDFEHQGKLLENDLLQEYTVTANTMRIELKAIKRR